MWDSAGGMQTAYGTLLNASYHKIKQTWQIIKEPKKKKKKGKQTSWKRFGVNKNVKKKLSSHSSQFAGTEHKSVY